MTDNRKVAMFAGLVSALCLALFAYILGLQQPMALGSAPSGIASQFATSSTVALSPTPALLFATSSTNSCASRVVGTTGAGGIMLTFSDKSGVSPAALVGFWQAASTTWTYDSGLFGCGAFRAYSGLAQTVTVMETN